MFRLGVWMLLIKNILSKMVKIISQSIFNPE